MLETLADHDDELMEQLLEDIEPPRDKVFDDLTRELREALVCPVLMGTATRTNGVLRLLKAMRHESPGIAATAKRLGVNGGTEALAYVLKTQNTTHGGKMSIVSYSRRPGRRRHDAIVAGRRSRACRRHLQTGRPVRPRSAVPPASVKPWRLPNSKRRKPETLLTAGKQAYPAVATVEPHPPVLAIAISAKERKDNVKLGQALHRLAEEDNSITVVS